MFNMSELLKDAGFKDVKGDYVEWEKPSDIVFPFGLCLNKDDTEQYSEVFTKSVKGINYIRQNMQEVTAEEFEQLCPVSKKDSIYKYLLKNIDRVRIVSRGEYHKVSNALPGYEPDYNGDYEFESDTPYGFVDVACMFAYSSISRRILFNFEHSKLNKAYQLHIYRRAAGLSGNNYLQTNNYNEGLDLFNKLKPILDDSDILLLYVSRVTGVAISHKKYKTVWGTTVEEVTSPCLGSNIKDNPVIMERLEDWLSGGGYIKDHLFYLICEDKNCRDNLYLSIWKDTIPQEYTVCFHQ